jgi:L1 cell adhesion molecule like protein
MESNTPEPKTETKTKTEMKSGASPAVGLDLGTTYSCVSVWRNGKPEVIANDQGNRTTPSYVAFTDDERLIGESAKNQAARNPANTVFDVKRLIGRQWGDAEVKEDKKAWPFKVIQGPGGAPFVEVSFKGETEVFAPEQISAFIVSKMKDVAEQATGETVKEMVITVPARFNDSQRQATKDAGRIAGVEVQRIINEPTAAVLAYGLAEGKQDKENVVLVFDLGGGTFDVSVISVDDGVFEVLATGGDTHLGGSDFDSALVHHFAKEIKRKLRIDLLSDDVDDKKRYERALKRLRNACERAKRALSTSTKASIEIDSLFDGQDFYSSITRARFEAICQSYFSGCLDTVSKVLLDAKKSKSNIDDVVLVGGSTRIPKIQDMLSKYFGGKKLSKSINPDEAVAMGACVQAKILKNDDCEETKDMLLMDVCPLSIGVETSGGYMTRIIERNSAVPTQKTQTFSTFADNQTTVEIKVFQGERPQTKDNSLLGTFQLSGIPPAPRGVPKIEISLELDQNSILKVSAVDKSTGKQESISIDKQSGALSSEDIERMVKEAEQYREEDNLIKERVQARADLENYLYGVRNTYQDEETRVKFSAEDIEALEKAVSDGLDWLDDEADHNREKDDYREYKDATEKIVNPVMIRMHQRGSAPAATSVEELD